MRSQEEIVARFSDRKKEDVLGFEVSEYACALDRAHLQPFLEGTLAEWEPSLRTTEDVLEKMKGYIDFAYNKVENERSISAERSVLHYIAWLWLIDNTELCARVEHEYATNYHDYGRNILDMIADHYGWPKTARVEDGMPPRNAELIAVKPSDV